MMVRNETEKDDFIFGIGERAYLTNTPAAVAICIKNRLKLVLGSWFLDIREGLDYDAILGYLQQKNYDAIIQDCVLNTQGVVSIDNYASTLDVDKRKLQISMSVNTIYGEYIFNGAI